MIVFDFARPSSTASNGRYDGRNHYCGEDKDGPILHYRYSTGVKSVGDDFFGITQLCKNANLETFAEPM